MIKNFFILIDCIIFFWLIGCTSVNSSRAEYVPELAYNERLKIIGEEYICWKDLIILGDDIYRLDHGVYKKTDESPDDFFGIEVSHSYEVKQYNNLIITVDEAEDEFIIYDLDSMDKYNYEIYDRGSIAGCWWYVYNGRIYYEVQEKDIR